jgi:hypothetical protein
MRDVSIPTALVLVLTTLTACAPAPRTGATTGAQPERQCFSSATVTNFRQGDIGRIYLKAGHRQVFEVEAAGACPDLDDANFLAIQSDYSVGSRLCVGDSARITVRGSTTPLTTCRVRINRRLTADEIAALPDRQRP